jgi:S-adenosyl-L-methionine hydrolase (adenosine-forming)
MKAAILTICPNVQMVDVTHEITPHDVMEAAFVLREAASNFPEGTIHLAVVDPGVGGARRPVALAHDGHLFVGPDNGLFTLITGHREPQELVELNRSQFWRQREVSTTFHGRDIFAPVAAHLAAGSRLEDVGTSVPELEPLHWALPIADEQGIQGWITHIDHFGNCITNISRELLETHRSNHGMKCYVGTAIIKGMQRTYSDVPSGEPLILIGSSDYLEIAVNAGNAARLFSIRKGASVNIVFTDRHV